MGAPADKKPRPEDVIVAEWDEDADAGLDESGRRTVGKSRAAVQDVPPEAADEPVALKPFRPFEDLPALPTDLARAFAAFERAIQRQKRSGWQEVSRDEVLAVLDALKRFVLASGRRATYQLFFLHSQVCRANGTVPPQAGFLQRTVRVHR